MSAPSSTSAKAHWSLFIAPFVLLRPSFRPRMRRGGRSRRTSEVAAEEAEILDESEQRAIVEAAEAAAQAQSRLWRRIFSGLGICVAAVLACAAVQHALAPWQVVFHADFYGTLSPRVVVVADLFSAVTIGTSSRSLLRSNHEHLRSALFAAIGVSLFWLSAWMRLYSRRPAFDVFKLLWLPLAPLYSAVCLYVDGSVRSTEAAVLQLRASQYEHKSA